MTEQGSGWARAEVSACVCTSMATTCAGSILVTYLLIEGLLPAGRGPAVVFVRAGSDAQKGTRDKVLP
jgi:hypothetical protein